MIATDALTSMYMVPFLPGGVKFLSCPGIGGWNMTVDTFPWRP